MIVLVDERKSKGMMYLTEDSAMKDAILKEKVVKKFDLGRLESDFLLAFDETKRLLVLYSTQSVSFVSLMQILNC